MKKSFSFFVMVALFLSVSLFSTSLFAASNLEEGISELAQQISKNMTETGKKKIAVVEFSNLDGEVSAFGQHLAEELITELFLINPGQFEVVERRQLMKVLSEQKLTMSGLLDAKAMETVGKILGIEAIVTGSVTDLSSNVRINARVIAVDTAKIFAVARTKIPKIGIVADLLGKKARKTDLTTKVPELNPNSLYANSNSRIFHRHDCPELDKTKELVDLGTPETARRSGAIPHKDCDPLGKGHTVDSRTVTSPHISTEGDWKIDLNRDVGMIEGGSYGKRFRFSLLYVEKKGDKLMVGIRFRNVTGAIQRIGLDKTYKWSTTLLNDDDGTEYKLKTVNGITYEAYSINPGAGTNAIFTFPFPDKVKKARFVSEWWHVNSGHHLSISIPFTIPPTE